MATKLKELSDELDRMNIFQRRFELITVSKFRDRTETKKASDAIDRIRAKTKSGKASMTGIIRKWRDTRYGSSGS